MVAVTWLGTGPVGCLVQVVRLRALDRAPGLPWVKVLSESVQVVTGCRAIVYWPDATARSLLT
jgi:hypothetical protein